jgi:aspartate racemase
MKRVGMIGGIGWPSTLEYYRLLNTLAGAKLGTEHPANLILVNLDSGVIRDLAAQNHESHIYELLLKASHDLKSGGAELLVLCANGVHRFFHKLQSDQSLPIINIANATAKTIFEPGLKKVALLGIQKTMEGTFYQDRLKFYGIQTLVPSSSERQLIDQLIYEEMIQGQFLESTKKQFLKIIEQLAQEGAEGIILGCTELPILIQQTDTPVRLFSSTEIHCSSAIEAAME